MQDEEQFTIRTKGALKRGRGEAEAQKARETPQEEKAEASAGEQPFNPGRSQFCSIRIFPCEVSLYTS